MWLYQLRDKTWNLLRWDIQHKAHWSNCSDKVLYAAAKKCAEGVKLLGYHVSDPPPDHDANFYKKWIGGLTNFALAEVYQYAVLDGSMTQAIPVLEQCAAIIKPCQAAAASLGAESETPVFYPANP